MTIKKQEKPLKETVGVILNPTVKEIQAKQWIFVLNNYTEHEYTEIRTFLEKSINITHYIMGREIGDSGTPHLQGYMAFKNKVTNTFMKKLNCKMHIEPAKGNVKQNAIYCGKDDLYICSTNCRPPRKLKCLREDQLYKWQLDILKILDSEADDRTIHWYYSKSGLTGKTTFGKYLGIKKDAIILEGRKNDILYVAAEFESELYIYDIERSLEEYVSYGAIEKIKNGFYMVAKYEGKPIIRNCPHVIIFANFKPEMDKLSKDRWHIVNIEKYNK